MDSYSNWDALGMMQQLGVVPPLDKRNGDCSLIVQLRWVPG